MFLYFGSKAGIAHTYQAPRYRSIVEPFAGAAGYSMFWLQKMPELVAYLIDSDERVVELWDRLLEADPVDIYSWPVLPAGSWTSDPIYKAVHVSAGSWNKPVGTEYKITEWMARDFPVVRRRIASKLAAVQGRITVTHGDYTSAPDMESTWFIDPPYQMEGHWYGSGNDLDWPKLGDWCRSRSGQIIVCESLGAEWMDFRPHLTLKTVSNSRNVEVVWYSHPEPDLLTLMEATET